MEQAYEVEITSSKLTKLLHCKLNRKQSHKLWKMGSLLLEGNKMAHFHFIIRFVHILSNFCPTSPNVQ